MVICEAPVLHDGEDIRIDAPGGMLRIVADTGTIFSGVEVCDYSNHQGKPWQVNRLRFRPVKAGKSGAIRYEIRPL